MSNQFLLLKKYQISRIVEMPGMLCFLYMKGLERMYLLYDVDKKKRQVLLLTTMFRMITLFLWIHQHAAYYSGYY